LYLPLQEMRMSFRTAIRFGVSLMMVIFAAVTSPLTYTWVAAQQSGYVVVSLRSDLMTMNPFTYALTDEYSVLELVYDPLYRMAPNGSFVPWLAERVEVLDNGTTWIFHIRKGVKWHDGSELTAEDVAFTFELTLKYRFPRRADIWQAVDSVQVLDPYTVEVRLKYPYAAFPSALSNFFIVQKKQWQNVSDPLTYTNFDRPIGTGPFKWVERRPGDYVKLQANLDYWAGRPSIEGVIFKIYTSSDAAYMAVLNGEIDAMNNLFIPPNLVDQALQQASNNPAIRIHFRKPSFFGYLTYMLTKYPFSIKEFREAMVYAINVTALIDVVYGGHADPGNMGTIPPVLRDWYRPGLEKEKLYPFNLSKAAEILDKLGFIDRDGDGVRETPNGTKLEFDVLVSSIYPDRIRMVEMIRDWFKQVGIKLNIVVLDHRTVAARLLNRQFDLVMIGIWMGVDPDSWFNVLSCSTAVNGSFNSAMYCNPEVDQLLEVQRMAMNAAQRREIVWKLQEVVANDIPYIVLVHIHEAYAYRVDRFTGWVLSDLLQPANFWSFTSLKPATSPTTTPTTISASNVQSVTSSTAGLGSISTLSIAVAVIIAVAVVAPAVYIVLRKRR